ncbi:SDR family oxidoreductase [Sphingosinicella sp. CPCC 101087]|uniref:SDR family oxidoreductase n=1 Tax=Sphingosinicella sp. CPCC 101087 TaxID=2497754 RepID=UPI00101DEC04|nr:SDR family NAD(P)-dependent oxidoreductase [Sphingosinicella sp. CPCC 101087]
MKLAGKSAIVTGGTDGIGKALGLALRERGVQVIVVGRDKGRLALAAAEGFDTLAADLASAQGVDAVVRALDGKAIDLLVNNAGAGASYDVSAPVDLAQVDRCIFLNLVAPIHLSTRLLPMLRARPQAMIVNITSGLAVAPRAGSPVYCATKAGLRSFTMALRAQLAGSSVRVLEVLPPVVETRMTAANSHRKMPVGECARQIVRAIEQDRDEANVGATRLLRLVYSVSPALARQIMLRY